MSNSEQILVTVRRSPAGINQQAIELEVLPSQTVGQIKQLAKAQDATLPVDELRINGSKVSDDTVLATLLDSSSELTVTAQRRTLEVTAGPIKRRKRCSFPQCTSAPLRGVGDCGQCMGHFCSKHRLMEQHRCNGLAVCKEQLRERNALKLQEQQTVANKV